MPSTKNQSKLDFIFCSAGQFQDRFKNEAILRVTKNAFFYMSRAAFLGGKLSVSTLYTRLLLRHILKCEPLIVQKIP